MLNAEPEPDAEKENVETYRSGSYRFMNSIIKQAKSRKSLSKKQMEAVSNLYLRVKKNIDKQHGGK